MKSFLSRIAVLSVAGALVQVGLVAAASPQSAAPAQTSAETSTQSASAPTLVRLDGQLKTPTGEPRTGNVVLVVSLYAGQDDPAPLWLEHQLVSLDQAGRYSIYAGATLPDGLPQEFFASGAARWLGVAVEGEAEQPRIMLITMPYALKARVADTLGGKTASDFVLASNLANSVRSVLSTESSGGLAPLGGGVGTLAATANALVKFTDGAGTTDSSAVSEVSGKVGIGTGAPQTRLDIRQAVDNSSGGIMVADSSVSANFRFWADAVQGYIYGGSLGQLPLIINAGGGKVGVGTAAPLSTLHILENANNPLGGIMVQDATRSANFRFWADANQGYIYGGSLGQLPLILNAGGGKVGIGTTAPTEALDVHGNINVTGNINAKYQDVAEWVEASAPLEAGTVVIVDPSAPNHVTITPRAYDTRVAGAVSRQPGLVLGERTATRVTVAQSGRVRVKADASYAAIRIGDLLVTSPTPGYAMRSQPLSVNGVALHRPGTVLGKALEALPSGKGEILVLLTLQ